VDPDPAVNVRVGVPEVLAHEAAVTVPRVPSPKSPATDSAPAAEQVRPTTLAVSAPVDRVMIAGVESVAEPAVIARVAAVNAAPAEVVELNTRVGATVVAAEQYAKATPAVPAPPVRDKAPSVKKPMALHTGALAPKAPVRAFDVTVRAKGLVPVIVPEAAPLVRARVAPVRSEPAEVVELNTRVGDPEEPAQYAKDTPAVPAVPPVRVKAPTFKRPGAVQVTPVLTAVRAKVVTVIVAVVPVMVPNAAVTVPVPEDSGRLTVPEYPVPAVPTVMVGAPEEPAHDAVILAAVAVAWHCPRPDRVG